MARVVSIATTFVTYAILLRLLGPGPFGVYATITAFIALLNFGDLGLGNSLVAVLSREDQSSLGHGRYVSTAFAGVSALALLMFGALLLVLSHIDLPQAFNVRDPRLAGQLLPALSLFSLFFFLNMPLSLVDRVQRARQRGDYSASWTIAANLMQALLVITAAWLQPRLAIVTCAYTAALATVSAANAVWLFERKFPELRPRLRGFDLHALRRLGRLGGSFLVIQASYAVIYGSELPILANARGPLEVTAFAIPSKLFGSIPPLLYLAQYPLWPAYSEAFQKGDHRWIRRTLSWSSVLTFAIVGVGALCLFFLAPELGRLWVGQPGNTGAALRSALVAWTVVTSVGASVAMFLSGVGIVRPQAVIAAATAAGVVGLRIVGARNYGATGLVVGGVAAYTLVSGVGYAVLLRRYFRPSAASERERGSAA